MLRIACYVSILLIDLAAIKSAFTLAGFLRGEDRLLANSIQVQSLLAVFYIFIAANSEAIDRSAFGSRLVSIMKAERTLLLAGAVTVMFLFFARMDTGVSRLALAVALVGSGILIAFGRGVFLTLFLQRRDEFWENHLLICDGTPCPADFAGDVLETANEPIDLSANSPEALARFGEFASRYDRIIVNCRNPERRQAWSHILKFFDTHGELMLDSAEAISAIGVSRIGPHETLVVTRGTLSLGNRAKKRCFDIVVSSLALLLTAPFLMAVALAIKLDSPGPVLFRQPRVGFHNRRFGIFKFRSMRVSASDHQGAQSTLRDDERITRVGRFIRRTSIDELPQLFNVLIGDMSIVGPRPHALGSLAGDELFWEVDRAYWRRHALQPGITGLAQVRGFRGATHTREDLLNRLGADMEYLNGWTLWRDIRIVLATVRVLIHPNAF